MSAESKPSEGAMMAVFTIFNATPHLHGKEAAKAIDRVAVAPAVRELVEALQRATQSLPHGKNYEGPFKASSAALADAEAVWNAYARYRHLLDQPEEKP